MVGHVARGGPDIIRQTTKAVATSNASSSILLGTTSLFQWAQATPSACTRALNWRSLKKMSGVHIQSVAWDKHGGSETATSTILVGGRSGDIFEAQLDNRRKDKYWKQVYQLDDEVPICGLEY